MFDKIKIKDKINEKDVGLSKDYFELLKQICGYEAHCWDDYVNTLDRKYLDSYKEARIVRSDLMDVCFKLFHVIPKDESWCKLKHCCTSAMHCQEDAVRLIENGLFDEIKILAEKYKFLYLKFLELLEINEENAKVMSSA